MTKEQTQLDQDIKLPLDVPTSHSFSMEKIYHFVCGECKNWWSHATDMVYRRGQNMSCPHCGEMRGIVKNDMDENPRWERDVT